MDQIVISSADFWTSSLVWGILDLGLLALLVKIFKLPSFRGALKPIAIVSITLWSCFATALYWGFWDLFYGQILPAWARWGAPLSGFFPYLPLALLFYLLSNKLPGNPILWFCFLGGLEGIAEHLLGIYGLRILEKVPLLNGVHPLPIMVFSFFEYILYWGLLLLLAWGMMKVLTFIRKRRVSVGRGS